jgi:diacylglycerol kinase
LQLSAAQLPANWWYSRQPDKGRGIAGKGARDLGHRRYASRQKYVLLLIVCEAVSIFLVSLSFRPALGVVVLLLILILFTVVKAIGRRIDRSTKEERRAIRSAKGEELIGAMLKASTIAFWFSTIFLRHMGTSTTSSFPSAPSS